MASSARLVTIKRSGDDGAHFPLTLSSCLFGRSIECDIRIQLPVVSKKHCKIEINEQEAILHNFSSTNPTQVNGATVDEPVQLKHGDVITIIDRSFRYENENHEDESRSPGFPGKSFGQKMLNFCFLFHICCQDGKGQDTNTSKTTASRRSLVHAKRLSGDSCASDGSKDSVTQDPSNTYSSGHVEQHSGRNTEEPISGVLFKKSRATGSSYRELKSSPAQNLSNSKRNESPFEKLYQSAKEELNIKLQKQSRRKSEPQPECAAGKETWETKLLVSCKSRTKSTGSTPGPAFSSPKVGKIWTEDQSSAMGPLQTSTETAKMKTPVRNSQQLKNEESHVSGRRESVNLNESEGAKADYKIVTPRKPATRNQTPVKVEDASNPAGKPENLSSKKRKSLPAKIEVLSAETQSQFSSTHHLASDEKKTPKDSFSRPEKLATAAKQIYSGLPGLSSVDISNFGDPINKSEGMSLKRRRVSFGGHLRPELFDENLPPNTPLKRGETPTKRKSLAPHTPTVLKKIIKERPQSPGKQESPGITPPSANDQRHRSGRSAPASSGSKSLPQTDTPKKAGRKSGNLPAKRASISRSQHDILQMISSKRRSGASEANLIVAKSWADVVKLGTKQTQTKVVKHVPQKQASKKQRRPNTPKKPTSNLYNQFSTGHANSPCTIVIGRAQIEKVSMPARPYKMLNNLMLNQKIDFSEDLSGLTEMFKTPVKEKQQQMNDMGSILSNSENLPEKQFQVTNSGDKPLPFTSEISGENVLSSTQNAAKEPSDKYSASPTLRRRSIKNGNTGQTPEIVHNITHLEKTTPGSVTEPLKTVSSVRKLRRSRELVESMNESTEADLSKGIIGRYLRKTSLQGQEVDQQVQDSKNCSQRFKENVELKEDPEKTSAMRSSPRKQKPAKDLIGSQMVTQTTACTEELFNQEKGTTEKPEESMHKQSTPISDGQKTPKQKLNFTANSTGSKRTSQTPKTRAQPLEDLDGFQELFQTPAGANDPVTVGETTKVSLESLQPEPVRTPASTKRLSKAGLGNTDVREELSTLGKRTKSPGRASRTPTAPVLEENDTTAFVETPKQKLDFLENSTGSKRRSRTQDLDGFQELFQTPAGANDPVTVGETTKVSLESLQPEPVRTPASTKRLSKAGLGNTDVREGPSTLGKRTKSPGRASRTPTAPELQENDTTTFVETPKQKLDFTENSTGSKRRSRTPKMRAQPLEDLDGFQELFQTPAGASDPVTIGETTKVSLESLQPEPVRTPASTKRLSKAGLGNTDVREEFSALRKRTKSPGRASRTPTGPVLEENDTTAFVETPKQKLDFTENSTGSKRRSRTPKMRAQAVEDLDGVQELFQTPAGASDPVTIGETTKVSLESLQAEPVRTPASTKRLSKAGLGNMDVREELSILGKRTKSPGRASHTPTSAVQQEKGIKKIMETSSNKLELLGNLTGPKKQSRTPKSLPGCQELFQTPDHSSGPLVVGKTKRMSFNSPQADPVITLRSIKRQSRASTGKMEVKEEFSESEKCQQIEKAIDTLQVPNVSNVIRAPKQSAKRKLDSAASLPGSKRLRRTSKDKTPCLEDLSGFQQLFQTPGHAKDSLTIGETLKMPTKSPQSGLLRNPTSRKNLPKISLRKIDVTEELSGLQKQSPGKARTAPVQEDEGIQTIRKTSKEKLEIAANVIEFTRQRRAPKVKALPLEDLDGVQELFQTPGHSIDPVIGNKRTSMSLRSPQPGIVRTSQTSKRLAKTSLGKEHMREEISSLNMLRCASGEIVHTPRLQEDDGRENRDLEESRILTLGPSVNVTGSKKQRGAHKKRSQSPEDIFDLQELFQTPASHKDSMTVHETTNMTLESSEHFRIIASTKRLSKAGLGNTDVREELSTLGKRTKSPGRASRTPTAPKLEENDITAFVETPKQKLDFTENSTGSKRRSRTPKMRAQPLEDLDGFQELFQTPAGASDPVTIGETTKVSLESLQPEPVRTPASTKRLSKAGLGNTDVREELSALQKRTKSPGRASRTPTGPVLEENDTTAFVETPKQKLDFTENSTGSKRRSRTPKMRAQAVEDLDGVQELFQTPAGASDPVTIGETTKVSLESLQAEPVRTPASTKRLSKAGLGKADVREQLSLLNKRRCSAKEVMHVLRLSENDGTGTKDLKECAAQILDPAVSVTSSKRQRGACKKRSQFPEDLSGLQELFQTPGHDKDSLSDDQLTKLPHRSLPPEPINTSVASQRQSRTRRMKVHVKSELSGDRMLPQMSEEIMDISRVPECEDKGIRTRKQSVKRKLDTAVSVPSSKRQRVARAEKAQILEDLPDFQELYQTPSLAVESVTVDKTTKISSKSPESMDPTSETQPGRRLRRMGVTKEPLAQRKTTRVLRETRNTYKEPVGDNKDVKELKESSMQKQDPTVILTSRRSQPRTLKEKTQPLKELPSIQEETATTISSEFPQPEEKETSASSKRQIRIQQCKGGVKKEPTAQRKPQGRVTRNTLKEPMSDSENVEELKESTKRKIDPVASVSVSKRPRRVPREKAQPLEVTEPREPVQIPGHTEELASDERPTRVSCGFLQPEQADNLQTSPRRLRTRRGKVEVDKEPSVVKKTVPTSRQTTRSRKVPEIDDKDTQVSGKQKLETVVNVTGSRRQLRAHKNEVQPLEVLGDSKKIIQISEHTEKLRHDTSTLKSTIQQMPDPIKPLRTSRRVLRTSKEDTVEISVDTRDPAESQSKNNTFLSPKRKSARDGGIPRTRGLCSVTPKQEATDEKPAPKKQRAAPSKRHVSPEPVKMKHLRIMSSKTEPVEEQISNIMKTEEEAQVENSTPPDQVMGMVIVGVQQGLFTDVFMSFGDLHKE
ncbi:Proliferation marker protein Ki-67 [Lemmus lemmus]